MGYYDEYEQQYVSDPRERFIDQRVDRFCQQGLDYWKAVEVAEKQADIIIKTKGFYPAR